jgi:hypothetical protein
MCRNFIAAALMALALLPGSVKAATITEVFTLTISPPAVDLIAAEFPTTAFPSFDPANGLLTSFDVSLVGPATWIVNTPYSGPAEGLFGLLQLAGFGIVGGLHAGTAGPNLIDFNLVDTVPVDSFESYPIFGVGTTFFTLYINSGIMDTLETDGALQGSITYVYTPGVDTYPVPEPST